MMRHAQLFGALLAGPLLLLPTGGSLAAQGGGAGVAAAGAGLHFQRFSFDEDGAVGFRSVDLLSLPLAARAELGGGLSLTLGSGWVQGRVVRADGSETSLSGITDTSVEVGWQVPGGRLRFSLLGVAPTGTTGFTDAELDVAGFLATDLFPFRVSDLGTGGGFGGGVAFVHGAGPWGVAAGASYLTARSFEPLAETPFAYRPGDQLSARLAVDRQVGASARTALVVTLLRAADDAVEGDPVFQPGTRVQVVNSWAFPVGSGGSGLFYGGYLHREGGRLPEVGEIRSEQGLLLLGAGLRQPTGVGLLIPTVDARLLRRDDGEGQGWIVGVGTSLERRVGTLTLVPSVVGRIGSVEVSQGAESGITGVEVGMQLRHGGGVR